MIIAVSSIGKDPESELDSHFGRARHYVLYDSETKNFEVYDNPAPDASIGVGIEAAEALIGKGIGAIITGRIGPNVFILFRDADIHMMEGISGTVHDNLKAYRKNRLSVIKTSGPDHAALRGI